VTIFGAQTFKDIIKCIYKGRYQSNMTGSPYRKKTLGYSDSQRENLIIMGQKTDINDPRREV
jgi:hypothetical protein